MVRQTSIEAYRQIEEEGLLSRMRLEAYKLLFNYGPCTANQLMAKALEMTPSRSHQSIESIGRRLSELRDCGVAVECGEVICPVTGRLVIQWDVTGGLPERKRKKSLTLSRCRKVLREVYRKYPETREFIMKGIEP